MYEVRDVKTKIKKVLDRHKDSQGNLASDSFRDMLAVEIECAFTKGNEAKENPLSIEMWKGYKDEEWHKEETEDGNRYTRKKPVVTAEQQRNYDFIMSEMSEGEREHLENWKSNINTNQMELKLDVDTDIETKHFADDFHEGKI